MLTIDADRLATIGGARLPTVRGEGGPLSQSTSRGTALTPHVELKSNDGLWGSGGSGGRQQGGVVSVVPPLGIAAKQEWGEAEEVKFVTPLQTKRKYEGERELGGSPRKLGGVGKVKRPIYKRTPRMEGF
jgi:hypothetical protein